MTYDDYEKYWVPVVKIFVDMTRPYEWNLFAAEIQLAKMTGMTHYFDEWRRRPGMEDTPIEDDLKQLLLALAGPHGKAIMRMHRIRKGLE